MLPLERPEAPPLNAGARPIVREVRRMCAHCFHLEARSGEPATLALRSCKPARFSREPTRALSFALSRRHEPRFVSQSPRASHCDLRSRPTRSEKSSRDSKFLGVCELVSKPTAHRESSSVKSKSQTREPRRLTLLPAPSPCSSGTAYRRSMRTVPPSIRTWISRPWSSPTCSASRPASTSRW